MSVEKVQRAAGPVWRVRWRDDDGKPHSRVIGRKTDALAFDEELKRAKRLGNVIPLNNDDPGETVAEFAKTWWSRYVIPSLSRHTQLAYASMLDVHIIPRIGDLPLKDATAETIWQLRADMTNNGVGDPATRKTLVVLQSMLQRAVEWDRITTNPAKLVKKPSQTRTRAIRPLNPLQVEAIRKALIRDGKHADAALIAVLAYAGLRPGEALGLRWNDIRKNTILVERSVAFGKLKTTKTGKTRTVKLLKPLAETLDIWKRISSRNQPTDLVFPAPDGSPWTLDRTKQLAQAHVRRCRGSSRPSGHHKALRPPPQLRQSDDRRGRHRGRGRKPGGPRTDDGTQHLRPPVRRA